MDKNQSFWQNVLEADGAAVHAASALKFWVVRDTDGTFETDRDGFPYGRPYRAVSAKMAGAGILNGKGQPYHPNHVRLLVIDAIAENTYAVVDARKDTEALKRLKAEIARALRLRGKWRRRKNGE
jgi:hypothetical protein